ncbi:MAG: sigma-54-dependent Fis family transcriptional regulator [Parachlamydiales bacterium]|nr:sigma-54-dependent Fis family transcriptional regulator [Parachlamydiales bacterium]
MIKKALIVDDEELILNFLEESLKRLDIKTTKTKNGQVAIENLKNEHFDLVITDMKMPIKSGIDVLKEAKKINPNIIVIVITAYGKIENAIESLNLGAFTYLLKPFTFEVIQTLINKANEHLKLKVQNSIFKEERSYHINQDIIAKSIFMQDLINNIEKIAKSNASVFISGESGTGKEVIAKLIHQRSLRKDLPFIKVNCAAISETLVESEFFGHEKGSFTGAFEQKKGRFELANYGTLLLDEITEIPINLQAKLLRAVQEQEFERVGGSKSIKVDIRFISTSNRDLKKEIEKNKFREDLFYRLNVLPINIPPLRERKDDIISLATYFLEKFSKENHKPIKTLSTSAKEKLLNYPWPGNVRELANIIERIYVLDKSTIIEKQDILLDNPKIFEKNQSEFSGKKLSEVEKMLILKTLLLQNNNRTKTAKALGISIRTLRNKLNQYKSNQ